MAALAVAKRLEGDVGGRTEAVGAQPAIIPDEGGRGGLATPLLQRSSHFGMPVRPTLCSTPAVTDTDATVVINATIRNSGATAAQARVTGEVSRAGGHAACSAQPQDVAVPAGGTAQALLSCRVAAPRLWSPDSPALYRAHAAVAHGGGVDRTNATFGIRTLAFDAAAGLRLNNASLKLRGGCVHHDNGPLGAMAIPRAEVWRSCRGRGGLEAPECRRGRRGASGCGCNGGPLKDAPTPCHGVGVGGACQAGMARAGPHHQRFAQQLNISGGGGGSEPPPPHPRTPPPLPPP